MAGAGLRRCQCPQCSCCLLLFATKKTTQPTGRFLKEAGGNIYRISIDHVTPFADFENKIIKEQDINRAANYRIAPMDHFENEIYN